MTVKGPVVKEDGTVLSVGDKVMCRGSVHIIRSFETHDCYDREGWDGRELCPLVERMCAVVTSTHYADRVMTRSDTAVPMDVAFLTGIENLTPATADDESRMAEEMAASDTYRRRLEAEAMKQRDLHDRS